jgi:hypothetical protein
MSSAILLIALLVLMANRRAGWIAAVSVAAVLAVPAALLWLTRMRAFAVYLLIATAAMATWVLIGSRAYGPWQLAIWVGILLIAQRASRATFRRHALLKGQSTESLREWRLTCPLGGPDEDVGVRELREVLPPAVAR